MTDPGSCGHPEVSIDLSLFVVVPCRVVPERELGFREVSCFEMRILWYSWLEPAKAFETLEARNIDLLRRHSRHLQASLSASICFRIVIHYEPACLSGRTSLSAAVRASQGDSI